MPGTITLEGLFPELRLLNESAALKVGVMVDATNVETGEKVAEYAADNEYGSRADNIPPRPFLRATFDANEGRYVDFLAGRLREGADVEHALRLLGEAMAGDVKAAISTWTFPPNSAATIVRKDGRNTPLRDPGALLKSITYRVDKG